MADEWTPTMNAVVEDVQPPDEPISAPKPPPDEPISLAGAPKPYYTPPPSAAPITSPDCVIKLTGGAFITGLLVGALLALAFSQTPVDA